MENIRTLSFNPTHLTHRRAQPMSITRRSRLS